MITRYDEATGDPKSPVRQAHLVRGCRNQRIFCLAGLKSLPPAVSFYFPLKQVNIVVQNCPRLLVVARSPSGVPPHPRYFVTPGLTSA